MEKAIIVIPARMGSTRFPNKPIAKIKGITMIERVWKIGKAVKGAADVIIATDDLELFNFAQGFGAQVVMTSKNCLTGTDRVAEVSKMKDFNADIYFSLQGDAVLTPPWIIEDVLTAMKSDSSVQIATPAVLLKGKALKDFIDSKKGGSSSGTTVTFAKNRDALYFSKALIPFARSDEDRIIYRHIGLYGYRQNALHEFNQLPEGLFEKVEKLEQLRALENGIPIRIVPVDYRGRTHGSVDRFEDVAVVEDIIEREGELL